ncbi:hypothetical protein DPMN_115728 [Dreissena polymorpha]|uniref:Uncharacterized protein n=1 Tax=Dreissena polymorpha TaxID=45954 RepID=A0A9D4KMZ8_DREPO|nr:hypothetical protein DPMN_115728 [Dreissena polymorpha]
MIRATPKASEPSQYTASRIKYRLCLRREAVAHSIKQAEEAMQERGKTTKEANPAAT